MDNKQLLKIRTAYDLTVKQYRDGIDPLDVLPYEFKTSDEYKKYEKESDSSETCSNAPENKAFLNPQKGMKFLDAGCCANLVNYHFYEWPSVYYGVDISPELITAMRNYAVHKNICVGGLEVAEINKLPFTDNFFDIASLIGVLEYVDLEYTESALREINRVLKPMGRMVLDIPNMKHPYVNVMLKVEDFLARPVIPKSHIDIEKILIEFFNINRINDKSLMLKYFIETKK